MISIYKLKPLFQQLLKPIVDMLAKVGITPNQVTIAAVVLSGIMGLLLTLFPLNPLVLSCVPIALILRMAMNAIDGMLASHHNMCSNLGVVLNELGDVIADTLLFLPFALVTPFYPSVVLAIIILSILSEMSGIIAVQIGKDRRFDGPMGKSDRAFVFGVVALLLGLGITPGVWISIVWLGVIALLILTIINRIKRAL